MHCKSDLSSRPLPRLVLMTGALVRGGMEMQFLDLAREHRRRGGEVVIIGDEGPLENTFAEIGSVVLVTHPFGQRNTSIDLIFSELTQDTYCAISLQNSYFSLLPLMTITSKVLICAHNRIGSFEHWLPPKSLSRFGKLVRALEADSRLLMSASNRSNAEGHARIFGLRDDAVFAWYPSVECQSIIPPAIREGPITIGVIARLSPEKLLLVEAALVLLQAALNFGENARLLIAGAGNARPEFEACVARSGLSFHVTFIGETDDAVSTCRQFDVTVANGRVALEALLAGSRLVAVSVDPTDHPEQRLHSVVQPSNVDELAAENFAPGLSSVPACDIWSAIEDVTEDMRCSLQKWVCRHRSSVVLYDEFAKRLTGMAKPRTASALEDELSHIHANDDALYAPGLLDMLHTEQNRADEAARELVKAQEWIAEQRTAIDWLAGERESWENAAKSLKVELESRSNFGT